MLDVQPMMIMTILNKKKQKWPKIIFLGTIINEISASGRGMVRGKMLHFVAFFVHFDKLIRRPPGPLWEGGIFSLNPKTLFKFKLLKIPIFWPIIFQRKGWWWWSIIWEISQIIHNFLMNTFLLSKDDKELRYRDAPLIIIFRMTMTSQDDILIVISRYFLYFYFMIICSYVFITHNMTGCIILCWNQETRAE